MYQAPRRKIASRNQIRPYRTDRQPVSQLIKVWSTTGTTSITFSDTSILNVTGMSIISDFWTPIFLFPYPVSSEMQFMTVLYSLDLLTSYIPLNKTMYIYNLIQLRITLSETFVTFELYTIYPLISLLSCISTLPRFLLLLIIYQPRIFSQLSLCPIIIPQILLSTRFIF